MSTTTTTVASSTQKQHKLEIRVQALKSTLGLVDHYYMVFVDDGNEQAIEYHPGVYSAGCILPAGTTKGYHVAYTKIICSECYNKIILNFNQHEDKRIWSWYPFLNCESMSTGFSVQTMMMLFIPFVLLFLFHGHYMYAVLIFLVGLVLQLAISKYVFSRTSQKRCKHIRY